MFRIVGAENCLKPLDAGVWSDDEYWTERDGGVGHVPLVLPSNS